MILRSLLKPRWQHEDAAVRKEAVARLATDDPGLIELARNDRDSSVRCAALARLVDMDIIAAIARDPGSRVVRDAALARLCGLVSGPDARERLLALDVDGLGEKICRIGKDPQLRMVAVERVADTAVLVSVALEDPVADVRYAAVRRITAEDALNEVFRKARKKDKRVARHAKDKLDAIEQVREARVEIRELCAQIEALADQPKEEFRVRRVVDAYEPLQDFADEKLAQRFERAHENWLECRADYERRQAALAEALAKRESLIESLEHLLADLDNRAELSPSDGATVDAALGTFMNSWDDGDAVAASEREGLERRYKAIVERIQSARDHLIDEWNRAQALRELAVEVERRLADGEAVGDELRQRAADLPWPRGEALRQRLTERLQPMIERAGTQGSAAQVPTDDAHGVDESADLPDARAIEADMDRLEAAVEAGEIKGAGAIAGRLRPVLRSLPERPGNALRKLERRFRTLDARLREMRDWRRWGSGQSRDELCRAMEALVLSRRDPETVAREVREARHAWQAMDRAGDVAPQDLWERFDAACTAAYEPCKAHFDEKARVRAQALEDRTSICAELEELMPTEGDPDLEGWKRLDKSVRLLKGRWRSADVIERRDWLKIEPRYREAVGALDALLDEERSRCQKMRERLIAEVEALAEEEDEQQAMNRARQAQERWQVSVSLGRKRENALWERFRAACDAVFARRRAQQEARQQAWEAHESAHRALLDQARTLVDEAPADLGARFRALRGRADGEGELASKVQARLDEQWRTLERTVESIEARRRIQARREAGACPVLEALADLEAALGAGNIEAVSAATEALEVAGPIDASQGERLRRARAAASGDADSLQALKAAQQGAPLRNLVIQAEIAAGLESPGEDAQTRMELQVERLSSAMGQVADDADQRAAEAETLHGRWCSTGPHGGPGYVLLRQRFEAAMDALWERLLDDGGA